MNTNLDIPTMMSFHARLIVLIAVIAGLLLPYFIGHGSMDAYCASADYQRWLVSIRPYA